MGPLLVRSHPTTAALFASSFYSLSVTAWRATAEVGASDILDVVGYVHGHAVEISLAIWHVEGA